MPRGPYFKYLFNSNEQIPRSTLQSWQNGTRNNEDGIHRNNEDDDVQEEQRERSESSHSSGRSSPADSEQMQASDSSSLSHMSVQSDNGPSDEDDEVNDSETASNRRWSADENVDKDEVNDEDSASENSYGEDIDENIHMDDQECPLQERTPLYAGCHITLEESRLLIISFALRFSLSDKAIENLIQLINCHLPFDQYGSLYSFKKYIPAPPVVKTEFYCPEENCERLVEFEDDGSDVECECGAQCNRQTMKKRGHYFLRLPLKNQLVSCFHRSLFEKLRWVNVHESDVISGSVYKADLNRTIREGHDISLQFNIDGVQVFKSSSVQLWPIQVSINELPYKL